MVLPRPPHITPSKIYFTLLYPPLNKCELSPIQPCDALWGICDPWYLKYNFIKHIKSMFTFVAQLPQCEWGISTTAQSVVTMFTCLWCEGVCAHFQVSYLWSSDGWAPPIGSHSQRCLVMSQRTQANRWTSDEDKMLKLEGLSDTWFYSLNYLSNS